MESDHNRQLFFSPGRGMEKAGANLMPSSPRGHLVAHVMLG